MSDYWKGDFSGKIKLVFSKMPWDEVTLNNGLKCKNGDDFLVSATEIKLFKPFKQFITIDSMKDEIPDSDSIAPKKKVAKKTETVQIDEEIKTDLAE